MFAEQRGAVFIEGDELHPPENVEKMRGGTPLDDEDRVEWLERMRKEIVVQRESHDLVCVACSALKNSYRARLRADDPPEKTVFVYLEGDHDTLKKRMEARTDHYMPASLLDSQLRDLEVPDDALVLDVRKNPEELVAELHEHFC